MTIQDVDQFAAQVRQLQLVEPGQLDRLLVEEGQKFPHPRALAQELLKRDWLTPYQINQLFLGQGADLQRGPYVVLQRIGEGGAGQVFKARHQYMRRLVALKIIRSDLLTDSEVVHRFFREIRVASQLLHPNVVHAYDAGPCGSTYFLAMEYVEGIDLSRLVKQSGPLPIAQACSYIQQAALGLQHAHEQGLVHRDIKPPNLILSQTHGPLAVGLEVGVVKVLDLGLARLRRSVVGETTNLLTPAGPVMLGTLDYMAPEQALDFHETDHRADIYSLGCSFYYLLTGQPPFPGGSLAQKLLRHQQAKPKPLPFLRADAPAELDLVVGKMLAKLPEERYQTAAEVATALTPFVAATVPAGGTALAATVRTSAGDPRGRQLALLRTQIGRFWDETIKRIGLAPK